MKPKLHMMQELLEYQAYELGNPRGYWEYSDEDFVGLISKLALRKGGLQPPGHAHRTSWIGTGRF